MAEMTIQLKIDPATGKKDIIIALRGDDDSLPHEHEQRHQRLVEKLIEGGVLKATEVGKIIVEREAEEGQPAAPVAAPREEERRAQGQSG
jgi:hypothetical protein